MTITELENHHAMAQAVTTAAWQAARQALRAVKLAEHAGQGIDSARAEYTRLKKVYEAASQAEDSAWNRLLAEDKFFAGLLADGESIVGLVDGPVEIEL